jgi:deoxyribodipyrimidine photo-lyase
MTTAIWWIRRDLRLDDNPALVAALEGGRTVVPVFILDDRLLHGTSASPVRNRFLAAGLVSLDAALRTLGSQLILRRGDPKAELIRLAREVGAEAVVAEVDHSPFAGRRDREVAAALPLQWVHGLTIQPPELVVRPDGSPYTVFGAFRRAWGSLPPPTRRGLLPAPLSLAPPPDLPSHRLGAVPTHTAFPPGEPEARLRLERFLLDRVHDYSSGRDRLDRQGTSTLSPYLRFGMLSARTAFVRAAAALEDAPDATSRTSIQAWIDELVWREFYIAVLHHFPHVQRSAFRPALRKIRWDNDETRFRAWTGGETGYPVIDAAMRQLAQTGWMPNRARMIVASFLTKDLLIDWRWGERWFMQHLIDGDPAANNGGWQWTAGVGTDAAPYFRIFNPTRQAEKFDPQGDYVRRWIPELRRVPDEHIHQPWRMSAASQEQAACRIGHDYPSPIIDHGRQREVALAAYRRAKAVAA